MTYMSVVLWVVGLKLGSCARTASEEHLGWQHCPLT